MFVWVYLLSGVVFILMGGFALASDVHTLSGVLPLVMGFFFIQMSEARYLKGRIEALEKRLEKSEQGNIVRNS